MSKYKSFVVRGTKRYMKDGRLIKENEVPAHILKNLQNVTDVNDAQPIPVTPHDCIFCGAYTNLTRFVNLQTVALCEEHYYSETIGKIAQKLREKEKVNA